MLCLVYIVCYDLLCLVAGWVNETILSGNEPMAVVLFCSADVIS